LYEAVIEVIRQISSDPHLVDKYVEWRDSKNYDNLVVELGKLKGAIANIDARRRRWDDAYEADVIDLGTYSSRVQAVEDERASIDRRIGVIQRELSNVRAVDERRSEILEIISSGVPPVSDRPATKVFFRRLIEKIVIRDGQIERIVFRRPRMINTQVIETTWDRFAAAEEINDLYASGADGLFVTLKDEGFWPEREFLVREGGVEYVVDVAVPCRDGTVTIAMGDRPAPPDALRNPDIEAVRRAVEKLGGEQPATTRL
jgi:hypothetical protein